MNRQEREHLDEQLDMWTRCLACGQDVGLVNEMLGL